MPLRMPITESSNCLISRIYQSKTVEFTKVSVAKFKIFLLVYSQSNNARILHYTDDNGLKVDAIYQKDDGNYALIEIKLVPIKYLKQKRIF